MHARSIVASAVLMAATAMAGSPGSAIILNSCPYPVYFSAVPAAGGGYEETSKTLQTKDTWSTTWTELSNGNGWSLKLSKTPVLSNILQYEYTFHNDGIIWYDLSCVDGNPWAGEWAVSATGAGCSPRQAYYRYDTDDAFGMQSCSSDASITVELCPGQSSAGGIVSSVIAAVTQALAPAPVVATTPTTTTTPTPTPATTHTEAAHTEPAYTAPAHTGHALGFNDGHFYNANAAVDKAPVPTTMATVVKPVVGDDGIVTEVVTVIETAFAYETYVPGKRHIHHPNHPHNQ